MKTTKLFQKLNLLSHPRLQNRIKANVRCEMLQAVLEFDIYREYLDFKVHVRYLHSDVQRIVRGLMIPIGINFRKPAYSQLGSIMTNLRREVYPRLTD